MTKTWLLLLFAQGKGARFRQEKRKYSQTRTVTVPQHVGDAEKNFTSPPHFLLPRFSPRDLFPPLYPVAREHSPNATESRVFVYPLIKSRNRTSLTQTQTHTKQLHSKQAPDPNRRLQDTHAANNDAPPLLINKGPGKHLALPYAVVVEAIQPISQTRIRPNRPNHVISHPALKI